MRVRWAHGLCRIQSRFSASGGEVFAYDADGRRSALTIRSNTITDTYYSIDWQVLQENSRSTGAVLDQYVWGLGYVDDLVLRDDNSTSGSYGKSGSGLGRRVYAQQDANFNVTSLEDVNGNVLERFVYDPYGSVTVLSSSWTTRGDGYSWVYLFQGLRYDPNTKLYNARTRDYSPTLGVWLEPDTIGYGDGMNVYQMEQDGPASATDPAGMGGVGHHIIPQALWNDLPDSAGKAVWDSLTTGPLEGGHGWDAAHKAYSDAVRDLLKQWAKKKKVNLKKLTADQAYEFFSIVVNCDKEEIHGFLKKVAPQVRNAAGKAFDKALEDAAKKLEQQGAKALAKKELAQTIVKSALKDLPVVTALFLLLDAKENGWAYATRNVIVPADLINQAVAEEADRLREWSAEATQNRLCNTYNNAGIDPNTLNPDDPADRALKDVLDNSH